CEKEAATGSGGRGTATSSSKKSAGRSSKNGRKETAALPSKFHGYRQRILPGLCQPDIVASVSRALPPKWAWHSCSIHLTRRATHPRLRALPHDEVVRNMLLYMLYPRGIRYSYFC